jgi:outer membrane protein assembly factor BamB
LEKEITLKIVNKKTTAIALFLISTFAISLVAISATTAHTPPWDIPTFAYINAAPNPVGVGQQVLIVFFLDKTFDSTAIGNDYRFHNYNLTIVRPDNQKEEIIYDVVVDTTSAQYYAYTPTQTGEYTLIFTFPGQDYNTYDHNPNSAYVNDTYLPSQAHTTLTVQEEPIPAVPVYPLPDEYWTRPIEGQNTEWAAISSNYLNPMAEAYRFGSVRFQPDGTAPNSPHVMWTKPIQFGGVVGGSDAVHDPFSPSAATGVQDATYYTGLSYEWRFARPIIIYGRLYYPLPRSDSVQGGLATSVGGGYICVDMRTGEEIWMQNYPVDPTFGSLEWFDSPNQHGVIPNGYLWATSTSASVTTWTAYDPWDGSWLFNITNVPSGTRDYGPNGEPIIYQLDAQNKWLALWNFTQVLTNGPEGAIEFTGYRPVGRVFNSTERDAYSWNVTDLDLPSDAAIRWPIYGDLIFGSSHTAGGFPSFGGGTARFPYLDYGTFWTISLKPESRGQLIWKKNYPALPDNITLQLGPVDPEKRVFFLSTRETMEWYGYNLDNGNAMWGPVGNAKPFNYYATVGSGGVAQIGYIAYGNLYTGGYGGEIFCFDSTTGDMVWSYGGDGEGNSTNGGLNTPWGLYPTFVGAIADGKVYVYSGEHSPNVPPYKGEELRCLNATTGEEVWTIDSWATVGPFSDLGFPVADGELAYLNAYDMQVYAIGKGPSATTVTASPKISVHGGPVLVEGTVIDISAGTEQAEQTARFPYGVPAVSDESMGDWMEYVYMQKPKPTDVTGVDVIVSVIDPNSNCYEVGRATSDANGMFRVVFTPEVPGEYSVYASFEGSESYWPSQAVTSIDVEETPVATPEPTPTPESMTDTYILGIAIAALIAIVIIGLIIILMLRKR